MNVTLNLQGICIQCNLNLQGMNQKDISIPDRAPQLIASLNYCRMSNWYFPMILGKHCAIIVLAMMNLKLKCGNSYTLLIHISQTFILGK